MTEKGIFRAAVPSGASTGVHEALELRDKEEGWWVVFLLLLLLLFLLDLHPYPNFYLLKVYFL